jgi:hypothetical protein
MAVEKLLAAGWLRRRKAHVILQIKRMYDASLDTLSAPHGKGCSKLATQSYQYQYHTGNAVSMVQLILQQNNF